MDYRILTLRDGRDLEYATNGVDHRAAIIMHQGTLADLSVWGSWLEEFARLGVAAVAFNRSGYGRSSAKAGRVTVDVAHDVTELADHLGLTSFVSVGWSGGGSHALATAVDPGVAGSSPSRASRPSLRTTSTSSTASRPMTSRSTAPRCATSTSW